MSSTIKTPAAARAVTSATVTDAATAVAGRTAQAPSRARRQPSQGAAGVGVGEEEESDGGVGPMGYEDEDADLMHDLDDEEEDGVDDADLLTEGRGVDENGRIGVVGPRGGLGSRSTRKPDCDTGGAGIDARSEASTAAEMRRGNRDRAGGSQSRGGHQRCRTDNDGDGEVHQVRRRTMIADTRTHRLGMTVLTRLGRTTSSAEQSQQQHPQGDAVAAAEVASQQMLDLERRSGGGAEGEGGRGAAASEQQPRSDAGQSCSGGDDGALKAGEEAAVSKKRPLSAVGQSRAHAQQATAGKRRLDGQGAPSPPDGQVGVQGDYFRCATFLTQFVVLGWPSD